MTLKYHRSESIMMYIMPKKIPFHPSTISSFYPFQIVSSGISGSAKIKYGALHTLYVIYISCMIEI